MTFIKSVSVCFQKYASFSGRSSRSEYWWFFLFCILVDPLSTAVMGAAFGVDSLAALIADGVLSFLILIPQFAVGARRLHDIGKSGWNQLLYVPAVVGPLIVDSGYNKNELWSFTLVLVIPLVVWATRRGQPEENKYGAALS